MSFEVSKSMPNPLDSLPAELPLTIKSINLMCAIMEGISYSQLFDDPLKNCMDRLLKNVSKIPDEIGSGAHTSSLDIRPALSKAFSDIQAELKTSTLKARIYFEERHIVPGAPPLERYIAVRLRTLLLSSDEFDHVCLPFMLIQSNSTHPTVSIQDMDKFFAGIGSWSLVDLYTKPKNKCTDSELAAIKLGKDKGILRSSVYRPRKAGMLREALAVDDFEIRSVNLLNNHKCNPTTLRCERMDNYWCNASNDGSCSAISD